MIRRNPRAASAPTKPLENVPLMAKPNSQSRNERGWSNEMGWDGICLFLALFIFAFGGMFLIIALTEHITELPKGHDLFASDEVKIGSAKETEDRIKRMERNIASNKKTDLSKKEEEENPNLLDMSKKPSQLYAPQQHDEWLDNWLFGGNRGRNKYEEKTNSGVKKEKNPWAHDESDEDSHLDWMKELFPHLYEDEKKEGSDGKEKKTDDLFGNLFGNPKPKQEIPSSETIPKENKQETIKPKINNEPQKQNENQTTSSGQQKTNTNFGQQESNTNQNQNIPKQNQNTYNQQQNQNAYNQQQNQGSNTMNNQENYSNQNSRPNYYNNAGQYNSQGRNYNSNPQYTTNTQQQQPPVVNQQQQPPIINQQQQPPILNQQQGGYEPRYNQGYNHQAGQQQQQQQYYQQPNYGQQRNAPTYGNQQQTY